MMAPASAVRKPEMMKTAIFIWSVLIPELLAASSLPPTAYT